jgi:hypothetical protein
MVTYIAIATAVATDTAIAIIFKKVKFPLCLGS